MSPITPKRHCTGLTRTPQDNASRLEWFLATSQESTCQVGLFLTHVVPGRP